MTLYAAWTDIWSEACQRPKIGMQPTTAFAAAARR